MSDQFEITPKEVGKVRAWYVERGGVTRWHNQEIGACRGDQITPTQQPDGSPARAPHWAMGNPKPLRPEDIAVVDRSPVHPPAQWFPVCEYCKGSGRRDLAALAAMRQESIDTLRARLLEDDRYKRGEHTLDNSTCTCWACDGTGHVEREIRVRVKREYWGGYTLTKTGKARAEKLAAKLGPGVLWDFQGYGGPGCALLIFYREARAPFTIGLLGTYR